jgi:predicted nucleotidyltransferase
MNWLSTWVAKKYTSLWINFKEEPISFKDAKKLINKYPSNYISEIKKANWLFVFEKIGRKRYYRLLSPNLFTFSYGYNLNIEWLEQSEYAHLILKVFKCLKQDLEENLISFGIYGSLSRGEAQKESDLDIFLITKELGMTLVQRSSYLHMISKNPLIQEELELLNSKEYYPTINYHCRDVEELTINYFMIDISFDLKILYDQGVLKNFLNKIQKIVKKQGIERKKLEGDKHYLDLNIKFGEIFEFEPN